MISRMGSDYLTYLPMSFSFIFGFTLSQVTTPVSAEMDPSQVFVLELLRLVLPLATLIATGVATWFAAKAAKRSTEAKEVAVVAVQQTAEVSLKADVLAAETTVMSGRLDGQLEKMMRLLEAKADLEGYQRAQNENATAKKADAAQARVEAKEDRAEGAAAATLPIPTAEAPVIPVETRTEAATPDVKP